MQVTTEIQHVKHKKFCETKKYKQQAEGLKAQNANMRFKICDMPVRNDKF